MYPKKKLQMLSIPVKCTPFQQWICWILLGGWSCRIFRENRWETQALLERNRGTGRESSNVGVSINREGDLNPSRYYD